MNLKTITFSALFLFFIGNTSAQTTSASNSDIANITLSVRDILGVQNFILETNSIQYFRPGNEYRFKILLNYESEINDTAFFRLTYSFDVPNFNGTLADYQALMLGTTVPVIIPPVKKNIASEYRPAGEQYPHTVISLVPLFPIDYNVTLKLCRYDSFEDYVAENGNCTESSSVTYELKAQRASSTSTTDSYTIKTYPNPTTDLVVIEYINTATKSVSLLKTPIQITIFNKEAIKVVNAKEFSHLAVCTV